MGRKDPRKRHGSGGRKHQYYYLDYSFGTKKEVDPGEWDQASTVSYQYNQNSAAGTIIQMLAQHNGGDNILYGYESTGGSNFLAGNSNLALKIFEKEIYYFFIVARAVIVIAADDLSKQNLQPSEYVNKIVKALGTTNELIIQKSN